MVDYLNIFGHKIFLITVVMYVHEWMNEWSLDMGCLQDNNMTRLGGVQISSKHFGEE